jgi:hypothetical protein
VRKQTTSTPRRTSTKRARARTRHRLSSALVATAAAALLVAAPAAAGPIIDRAVEGLERDNVYVEPVLEGELSGSELQEVRDAIAEADAGDVFVAVLPDEALGEAGGDADELAYQIGLGVEENGTYAVLAGDDLGARSTVLEPREAGELADEAEAAGGDASDVLVAFVERLAEADGGGGGGGGPGLWLLLILVGVGALAFLAFRRRGRREADAELAEVKAAAQEDPLAFADEIRALDLDVQLPGANEDVRRDYERGLALYERADRDLDRARRVDDLEPVSAAIEEGRWLLASARARLEGRELPERRPPCFFDPRHGPSTRDVEWTPPWGAPRLVPACEADSQRVEQGLEPASREVLVDGRRTPYWDAPPAYGPWAGGFFGGFGGLFPGILIGSILAGAFAPPVYADVGGEDVGGDDMGDGDFGDGDFGGGDFGGGDFGGGDF